MQTPIDLTDAQHRYPDAVQAIAHDLNRKLLKAKKDPVTVDDIAWVLSWATSIGGPTSGTLHVSLAGTLGQRASYHKIGDFARAQTPPPEIARALAPAPAVTAAMPHITGLSVANLQGKTSTHLVVAGYAHAKKGRIRLLTHEVGKPQAPPILYTLTPQGVLFAGGLQQTALAALTAAPEGGTWTWRSTRFVRMEAQTLRSLVPSHAVPFLGVDG